MSGAVHALGHCSWVADLRSLAAGCNGNLERRGRRHRPPVKIEQLEHIIRAAAVIADDDEHIIIGSQAILGAYPRAPESLLVSAEAVYSKNHPERADLINGRIGELSPFHETFGYYTQGVAAGTRYCPKPGRID